MAGKSVQIRCKGASTIDFKKLEAFQGELKILTEDNFKKLRKSILSEGFTAPIHVWKNDGHNYMLDGHQRFNTLTKLADEGYEIPAVPIDFVTADSFEQAKRILLSHASQFGKVQAQGLYEQQMAAGLSIEQIQESYNYHEINMRSYAAEYFKDHMGGGNTDPDDVPEVKKKAKSKRGEIYQLGPHRLMCGDSTSAADVAKLMGDEKANMVWTDPPYNVAYTGKTKEALTIQNDEMDGEQFYEFLFKAYKNMIESTLPGGAIYVAHADSEGMRFRKALVDAGWLLKQCLIWVKHTIVMGRQDYHWKHEPILYGWAPGSAHSWYTDRKQSTVLEFNKPARNGEHPTMKPVELVEYMVRNSSKDGDLVLDLFGGSGTTLMASEKSGRRACLMELDPCYVDVIITRWEQFTGQKAQLLKSKAKAS